MSLAIKNDAVLNLIGQLSTTISRAIRAIKIDTAPLPVPNKLGEDNPLAANEILVPSLIKSAQTVCPDCKVPYQRFSRLQSTCPNCFGDHDHADSELSNSTT